MKNTYVAIMAGGIGSRFWPASRTNRPKQFLDILNTGQTLLQITYNRFATVCPTENIFIVTSEDYFDLVKEQLPALKDEQILCEPTRRNTAPCIAYVSKKIDSINPLAKVIVVPSDHLILREEKFIATINQCLEFIEDKDVLVTLGIRPLKPSTGYGYIQYDEEQKAGDFYKVKTFTEKPTLEIAKTFVKSGEFLWNSGMFVWKAKSILAAMQQLLPEVYDCFEGGEAVYNTPNEKDFIAKAYSQCTNISIDYGVMEKAKNVYTIPSDFGWSDIGTWDSLHDVFEKDYLGNAVIGKQVKIYDSSNNMIFVPSDKLVVVHGLENYCVIDTKDVLLICDKQDQEQFRQFSIDLKKENLDKFL